MLLILLCSTCCFGQELPATTQQQVENLQNEDLEDDALLLQLDYYKKHPINLNTATSDELQALFFLSHLQIVQFIQYRNLFGNLLHLYELQAVPGFDVLTIKKLLPFVYVGDNTTAREKLLPRFAGGDKYLLMRLSRQFEKARGYNESLANYYRGNQNHLLLRYRYQYKTLLYYGLVADKDAGEQFFKGAQKTGFDFYSFHLFARNLGKIKSVAVGDYVVNLGQGLTQWQSMGFGKSADVINIKRQSAIILPYRSAGEFYFNRGAAVTYAAKKWEGTAFVSYKNFSGNLVTDSTERFTSFGTSGYYRTQLEISDRNKLSDFSAGGNFIYKAKRLQIGANLVAHKFSLPFKKSSEPYNYFAFEGKELFNASIDYSYTHRNAHFFGEMAMDKKRYKAIVQGLMLSVDAKVDLSFLYRRIDAGYQSLFGNAFTENSLPGNENGMYTGVLVRPLTNFQVSAYADFYQFPFIKYRLAGPARGQDYLIQLLYVAGKKAEVYARFRSEAKPLNPPGAQSVMHFPEQNTRKSLRLHYSMVINPQLSLKARTEASWFLNTQNIQDEGFLTYIEAGYTRSQRLEGNVRLQYFETDSYNSRIYAFESDVLYGYSIPAFFNKGFRYYLNLQYNWQKNISFWFRLARTSYKDVKFIGSGLDEISGNHKTDFRLQARLKF